MTKRSILITGASSGIGAALAIEYATKGTHLILTGRNVKKLKEIGALCSAKGAKVSERNVDVRNKQKMDELIRTQGSLDIVFANAGIAHSADADLDKSINLIFSVNVNGVVNTIVPAIETMKLRGGGQIGIE